MCPLQPSLLPSLSFPSCEMRLGPAWKVGSSREGVLTYSCFTRGLGPYFVLFFSFMMLNVILSSAWLPCARGGPRPSLGGCPWTQDGTPSPKQWGAGWAQLPRPPILFRQPLELGLGAGGAWQAHTLSQASELPWGWRGCQGNRLLRACHPSPGGRGAPGREGPREGCTACAPWAVTGTGEWGGVGILFRPPDLPLPWLGQQGPAA